MVLKNIKLLSIIIIIGHKKIVDLLLKRQIINIFQKNIEEKTPFDLAKDPEIIKLYKSYFAEKQKKKKENKKITIHNAKGDSISNMFKNVKTNNPINQQTIRQKVE